MNTEARRCQYHCSGCGSHFTSLQAFDDHRVGGWDARSCWDEGCEDRLEIVREDGICDIDGPPRIAVRLWRRDPTWRADASTSRVSRDFPAVDAELDPEAA